MNQLWNDNPILPLSLSKPDAGPAAQIFLPQASLPAFTQTTTPNLPTITQPASQAGAVTGVASTATLTQPPTSIPNATPPPQPGNNFVRTLDNMLMVYVPKGPFLMGSSGDAMADKDESPQHTVELSGYWIDQHEVTNAMFQKFVNATGFVTEAEKDGSSYIRSGESWVSQSGANWQQPTGPGSSAINQLPVVHVNLFDAQAYCNWAGGRLPNEEEWEKAARGTNGSIYPWGNMAPTGAHLNMADQSIALSWSQPFNDGYSELSPVMQYPEGISPYGAYDMAGNAWEWTQSCYSSNYQAAATCTYYVIRGGSFSASLRHVRSAGRKTFIPDHPHGNLGFRCVIAE